MRSQPTHFVSGLQGGYSPNVVEHYDTKSAALDALATHAEDLRDIYWNQPENGPIGDVRRDGLIVSRLGMHDSEFYDYALIEPCEEPETCEANDEEGWDI